MELNVKIPAKKIREKSEDNSEKYKQQRNYCVKLLSKTKMEFFQNMDVTNVNKKVFWKTVKPRFSMKCETANTVILTERDIVKKNEKLIAYTFDNNFGDITTTLKLKKHPNFDGQALSSITDCFKDNENVIKTKNAFFKGSSLYLVIKHLRLVTFFVRY